MIIVDKSPWILDAIKDSISWWLVKTTGPMQRIGYGHSNLSYSVLSWIDSDIVNYGLTNDFQEVVREGKWKVCE